MSNESRAGALRADLRVIWVDGLAYSLMLGMGETYIPAFALAVGLSSVQSGLVSTVPMLIGSVLQLASPACIARIGSHRRWVVMCVALQAASFVPLIVAGLLGRMSALSLFGVASLYWACGLAGGPAWSTWIETLVPRRVRIRYFARRTRMLHGAVVGGMFAAGWILQAGEALEQPLQAFALVFLSACAARVLSASCLARQSEPQPMPAGMRAVSPREFVARFRAGPDGKLLVYMLSVQFSVRIAEPFFTPWLLGPLKLSYAQYMSLFAAGMLAKLASAPAWGWFARRFSVRALLFAGGIGIVPSAALWLVSPNVIGLLLAQLFAGTAWAAWELATFLLFFDAIRASERTSVLTTFNFANSVSHVLGSVVGSWLLAHLGGDGEAFAAVFIASSILRLATLFLLARVDPSHAPSASIWPAPASGTGSIDTGAIDTGAIDAPVLSVRPDED